jgi:hypothetical protein
VASRVWRTGLVPSSAAASAVAVKAIGAVVVAPVSGRLVTIRLAFVPARLVAIVLTAVRFVPAGVRSFGLVPARPV